MSNNKQSSSVEKEFIPYEEALALKELGFNKPCLASYYHAGKRLDICEYINHGEYTVLAPTFSQAFRWFREKHNLYEVILPKYNNGKTYFFRIETPPTNGYQYYEEGYSSDDLARLACLRKLIEIVL